MDYEKLPVILKPKDVQVVLGWRIQNQGSYVGWVKSIQILWNRLSQLYLSRIYLPIW